MPSTVINKIVAAFLFAISTATAAANGDKPPRFLTVPVLGLRLPLDQAKLEAFAEGLRVKCPQLYDAELYTSRVWIFGQARNAASTYYILSGYSKRLDKQPDRKRYTYWDNGAAYTVTGAKCGGDDAKETFEVHDPDADNDGNVPIPILKTLAFDMAARTIEAVGGADRLRAEIRAQRIDFGRLPPALQEAFGPYFGSAK